MGVDVTVFWIGLLAGLALASVYLLIAMSFTIIVGVSGVFNLLQATWVMLATVASYQLIGLRDWNPVLALLVLMIGGAVAGLLTNWIIVQPAEKRSDHVIETTLLTTLGASTAIAALAAMRFGSDAKTVHPYVSSQPWMVADVPVSKTSVLIIAVTFVIAFIFERFLHKSAAGLMTRVTLEDPEGAELSGIRVRRVVSYSFAGAGALAALAGWMVAPVLAASTSNAQPLAFYAFAAMALGGFGSFTGAAIGALVVGLLQGMLPLYINPSWTLILVVLLVTALLIVRPAGIRGVAGLHGAQGVREI